MIALAFALILTWTDNSLVEDGYRVYRQAQGNKNFAQVATLPAGTVRWVDTGTRRNRTYCYFVVAYKAGAEGGYSNVKCARDRGTGSNLSFEWDGTSRVTYIDMGQYFDGGN